MRSIFHLPVFLLYHLVMAQGFDADKKLKEIDSLILYSQFEAAKSETGQLFKKLQSDGKNEEKLLEAQFRQALILDRQDASPNKALHILFEIIDRAEAKGLHALSYRIYLLIALAYEKAKEKSGNLELTNKYLKLANQKYKKYNLESTYSTYCIRKSSYHRYLNELDSVVYYANQARLYSKKYKNQTDLTDSYILLGIVAHRTQNYTDANKYGFLLLDMRKRLNDSTSVSATFNNISGNYLKQKYYAKALAYSDSAYVFYKNLPLSYKVALAASRYKIFEALGVTDSAFYYFRQHHEELQLLQNEEEQFKSKEIEERYQNVKKEAVIQTRNQQITFVIGLLACIAIASVLLFIQNRKINSQNKIINKQLEELSRTLEQKQILLSELQHRVKNNLQHVISILEIQKESVNFNNIEELLRGNQNRIHSMALLHKKLNVSDNVNDVDMERYITELSELVKESYDDHKKKITLNIKCGIESISIEKALPLGLIVTELVSNSMKHAFKRQNIGIVTIEIIENDNAKQLYYSDNGIGYDFKSSGKKGMGQEIIKGLIDQLDGTIETSDDNGFELTICFR